MSAPTRKRISRRTFLISAGVATVAIGGGVTTYAMQTELPFEGTSINAFVALTPDGSVEVVCPAQNIGQGAPTTLAMILAEEMGAALDKVKILPAPRDAARYGNPEFSGRMVTADSKTTTGYWPVLRLAGAEARKALIATAASSQGWNVSDCFAMDHYVTHRTNGARMSFGEIAALGRLTMPGATEGDLKTAETFSLLGKSPVPADTLEIVTGQKKFGTDIRDVKTSVAVLRRSPHLSGTLVDLEDTAARSVSGVEDVVTLEDASAVAVVASNTWSAIKGAKLLDVTWTAPPEFSSESEKKALEEALVNIDNAAVDLRVNGDATASGDYFARFYAPTLTHLLPEPLNATAESQNMGLGVRISGSTQSQDLDMRYGAQTWKTAPFMVSCVSHPSGGAYGRRVLNDVVRDVAEVAKTFGRPVQVIRPLSDELQRGQVRAAALQHVNASLNPEGGFSIWQHNIASDGALAAHLPSSMKGANGDEDNTATDGARHPYNSENEHIRWTRIASLPSPSFLRGVAAAYTAWAIETSVERMARQAGLDPLEWRLRSTPDQRLRNVIDRVGVMSGWGDPARKLGLGAIEFRGARAATVAEVVDDAPVALWVAVDVGQVIHRKQVLGQIEGGIIWGLSMALSEELVFENGAAQIDSMMDYPTAMNGDLPEIHIELLETAGHPPAGAGEIGIPMTIPAICNALEYGTERQFDALPFRM